MVGQQAIVIKPLGGVLEAFDFFAGGALLADGDVAFVLDLSAVCRPLVTGSPLPDVELMEV
ncbi:MAG: hypothetical protein AAGA03_12330 [Planctomycetota bacterium]